MSVSQPLGGVLLPLLLFLAGNVSPQSVTDAPPARKVTIPPLIIENPAKSLAFREGESLEMTCVASGQPNPSYRWEMNSKPFDPSGLDGRVAIQPGVGTLIFARPKARDEAIYQCFAENDVGIAASVKVDLRLGILESFTSGYVREHRPDIGEALTLPCTPPVSFPEPLIYWALVEQGSAPIPLDLTARVSIDPEGNLNLANVIHSDGQGGKQYVCIVQNSVMRQTRQGEYSVIIPQGEVAHQYPPDDVWSSPANQVALLNEKWSVKCIISGNPTPRVTWSRLNYVLPVGARIESFGQELVLEHVQLNDEGTYECVGENEVSNLPTRNSFTLRVEAAPYWVDEPQSIDTTDNQTAFFTCGAFGIPQPRNTFYINNIPITEIPSDPRRILEGNTMTIVNLTKDDAMVIQCNSTNSHGYVFKNFYLNVLSEPPMILEPPQEGQKVAEGQTINLTCTVFGSPKPQVLWRKGNEQLTGGRFRVLSDGNLEISDVSLVDAGTYTCTATNRFDTVSATGSLIVRRRTEIRTAPLDVMVYEGTEAKFTCTATTDPEEIDNLEIHWKKDGEMINYGVAQRMFKNEMDNSLTLSGTISLDTAKYTCVAMNGLDEDEMSAQLVVQGPPDPPNDVITWCYLNTASIEWHPGKENYAPILNFIIQYSTSFAEDTWIDIATNVSQNDRKHDVDLSPNGNYTFRVLARNKIGLSQPSIPSRNICRTEEDIPDKNPDNVMGEGDEPDNLVIFWTPMPEIEHNGRNFEYVIWWRRNGTTGPGDTYSIQKAETYFHVVPGKQPTYTAYEIYVKAKNTAGDSRVPPKIVIGWSGEDEPMDYPNDVTVDLDSVTGTSATLQWTQVDTRPAAVRGSFRGYRIQFWRRSDGFENMREHDLITNETSSYPRPRPGVRAKRDTEEERVIVHEMQNLPPFSEVAVQIRVLNKYYAGPPSPIIYFTTKEGSPGPPMSFRILAIGATHFELLWNLPEEPNGILVGYNMSYQSISGLTLGRLQYREAITNPNVTRERLTGLQPDMQYRVYLSAVTRVGIGEPIFIDAKTAHAGPPSPPTFDIIDLGDTFVIVKWTPSRTGNPGSVFYVQYRPRSSYHWEHGSDEALHYVANVSELFQGTLYQIRVVSKNGAGEEAPSEWQEFLTGGLGPGHIVLASSGWFYGIFASLILIIAVLASFVFLKRKRDEWWERKEGEIEEQVRQLQAEEATRQMGIPNMYGKSGSQEMLAAADDAGSLDGSYKEPLADDEEYEEGEDEEEDEEEESEYETDEEEEYEEKKGMPPGGGFGGPPGYGAPPSGGYQGQGFHPGYAGPPQGGYQGQGFHPGYSGQGQGQQMAGFHPGLAQGPQSEQRGYNLQGESQSGQGASFI